MSDSIPVYTSTAECAWVDRRYYPDNPRALAGKRWRKWNEIEREERHRIVGAQAAEQERLGGGAGAVPGA